MQKWPYVNNKGAHAKDHIECLHKRESSSEKQNVEEKIFCPKENTEKKMFSPGARIRTLCKK